jgi:CubicO group peptidase (beta-lactamase class C family)
MRAIADGMKSASAATLAHPSDSVVGQTRPRCYDLLGFSPLTATFVSLMLTRLLLASSILCASGSAAIAQQNLNVSLFEKYVESLREEAGIPGISAAIVQDGNIVWDRGFGRVNLDATQAPTIDTPYLIGGLSQTLGSTLVLRKCLDQSYAALSDTVVRWAPFGDQTTTLAHLMAHATSGGTFRFDSARFAVLTKVVEECATAPYARLLEDELFGRLAMVSSVPGSSILSAPNADDLFSDGTLARYSSALRRLAVPYRVDRGRATRSEIAPRAADAATGVISSVADLARFDAALRSGALLTSQTRQQAWTQVTAGGAALPTGLGWFVQNYNNQAIVWHFGVVEGGYSSLIVKVPNRGITLIMLANSDGLSAPFGLENGDVQKSLFAQTFLKLFVP